MARRVTQQSLTNIAQFERRVPLCETSTTDENKRLFGYGDRSSPRKAWDAAIEAAGIEHLSFLNAGRHGFGQEMNVRTPIDEKAAGVLVAGLTSV